MAAYDWLKETCFKYGDFQNKNKYCKFFEILNNFINFKAVLLAIMYRIVKKLYFDVQTSSFKGPPAFFIKKTF